MMEPTTIANFITLADPQLLDIAYSGRHILRVLEPGAFYKVSAISKMACRSKRKTRRILNELVEAGLVHTVDFSDLYGGILYGTQETREDFPWDSLE